MAKTQQITITAKLQRVTPPRKYGTDKYTFAIIERTNNKLYKFLLSTEKAQKLANGDMEFPLGANLRLTGRVSNSNKLMLNFVAVKAVDGHDLQAWAERNASPGVPANVLSDAQRRIQQSKEDDLRRRAPVDELPAFNSPKEAYDAAMYILRRQVKAKNPKLTNPQIWAIRDALNVLADALGNPKIPNFRDGK